MKKVGKMSKNKVVKVFCNCCGKQMQVERGVLKEGSFSTSYEWGYFSDKDGEIDSFDLCEECYDKIVSKFVIPVEKGETIELL